MALALSAPQRSADPSTEHSVTLITGDRVIVRGQNGESVSIVRARGRENVRFVTRRIAPRPAQSAHLYAIPEDAMGLIASGKVDRRLFDVTLLIEYAYDDAHRDSLPLIATYSPHPGQPLRGSARAISGAVMKEALPSINGMSLTASKAQVQSVWAAMASAQSAAGPRAQSADREPIGKLWLDGLRQPLLDQSVPQIGAPAAWERGFQGNGVVVAVLDTGVNSTHPDLVDRVIDRQNFTEAADVDDVGHGTHVASIIAGSGAASDGRYRRVAPQAQLASAKVCMLDGCEESSIIAGMEWAAAEVGVRVANLSLGGPDDPEIDPLEEAVNTLTAQYGTLFVISAGNAGPDAETISSPGSAEAALTVGAVDRDDQIAWFSSRGPTVGTHTIKPELTAPGVDIVAARAAGTELGELVGESYVTLSGTSMAAPHVSGAVALLLEQHPGWGPAEVKAALMGSAAYDPGNTVLDQGAGRVDAAQALDTSIIAETPSVSFSVAQWRA